MKTQLNMYYLNNNQLQMYALYFQSVDLLRCSYENLFIPALECVELSGFDDRSATLEVILTVSLVIDQLARTLKIARKLSGLNQKKDPLSSYIISQSWVIDARNIIQHINNEIRVDGSGPMLGSVSWVGSNELHYTVSLTTPIKKDIIPGLISDRHTGKTTIEIAYAYNERYLDIKSLFQSAIEFSKKIRKFINIKNENGDIVDIFSDFIAIKTEKIVDN